MIHTAESNNKNV